MNCAIISLLLSDRLPCFLNYNLAILYEILFYHSSSLLRRWAYRVSILRLIHH